LQRLDRGGTVVIGSLGTGSQAYPLNSATDFHRDEWINVSLLVADAAHAFAGPLTPIAASPFCSLIPANGGIGTFIGIGSPFSSPTIYGDAGVSLTLSGPSQQPLTVPKSNGTYSKHLDPPPTTPSMATLAPSFFSAGLWDFERARWC